MLTVCGGVSVCDCQREGERAIVSERVSFLRYCSLDATYLVFIFVFEMRSLTDLGLTKSQAVASGICLSLPPSCWDYKHMLIMCQTFLCGVWDFTQVLMVHSNRFTNCAISQPLTMCFLDIHYTYSVIPTTYFKWPPAL